LAQVEVREKGARQSHYSITLHRYKKTREGTLSSFRLFILGRPKDYGR